MAHNVAKEDQHKWKKCEVLISNLFPKEQSDILRFLGFHELHICTRGDCRCIKLTKKEYGIKADIFFRSGTVILSMDRPDCFGDTLINEQKID